MIQHDHIDKVITDCIDDAINDSKTIISFDFDNTLSNHINNDTIRLKTNFMKSIIKNTTEFFSIIVSSRKVHIENISDWCKKENLDSCIPFIIHSVPNKSYVLKKLKVVIHFDDDPDVIKDLYNYGITGFISSEWLCPNFVNEWFDVIGDLGHIKYFNEDNLKSKKTLSSI